MEPLFDWIIVDSPPAIPVSDASVLAKACDGVLMVVRSNSTPSDVARKAREEFPDQSLVGVVLNGTSDEAAPYARYYYEAYEKQRHHDGLGKGEDSDSALQRVLPSTDSGASARRSAGRWVFVRTGNDVERR